MSQRHLKAESIDTESRRDALSDDDDEDGDDLSSVFCPPLVQRGVSKISKLMIANARGDLLAEMTYERQHSTSRDFNIFYEWWARNHLRVSKAESEQRQPPPLFTSNNTHYLYIVKEAMIFIACSKSNISPSFGFEFLYSAASTLGDFLGELSECNLQLNQHLVCEILNEMVDDGLVQSTGTSELKKYVEEKPVVFEDVHQDNNEDDHGDTSLKGLAATAVNYSVWLGGTALSYTPVPKIAEVSGINTLVKSVVPVATALATGVSPDLIKDTAHGTATMDSRGGITQHNNKLFLDLTEEVSTVWDSDHNVLRSEVTGRVNIRNYISGRPKIEIALSNNLHIEELDDAPISASQCVRLKQCCFHREVFTTEWEAFRAINLKAPEGETRVMTYRCIDNVRNPFKIYHHAHMVSAFNYEVLIKLRAEFPSTATCKSVTVRLDVLPGSSSAGFEFGIVKPTRHHDHQKAELIDNCVTWRSTKLAGSSEHALRCKISSVRPIEGNDDIIVGPVTITYEVIGWTASHVRVQYLRLASDRNFYKPEQYLRYTTISNSSVKQKQQSSVTKPIPSLP